MKLFKQVVVFVVTPLLIVSLLLCVVVIAWLLAESPSWTKEAETTMEESAKKNLEALVSSKAQYATESLHEVASDLKLFQSVLNDTYHLPQTRYLVNPTSLYGVENVVGTGNITGITSTQYNTLTEEISSVLIASCGSSRVPCSGGGPTSATLTPNPGSSFIQGSNWLNGVTADAEEMISATSGMDAAFIPTWKSKPSGRYQLIYVGTELAGVSRWYPFKKFGSPNEASTSMSNKKYACRRSPKDSYLGDRYGYDPRCRDWYGLARDQHATGNNKVVFTAPYNDAGSDKLVISGCLGFESKNPISSAFGGVLAIDFTLTDIQQAVTKEAILTNGYGYLINYKGEAVMHKEINWESTDALPTIENLEFGTDADTAELTAFTTLLAEITTAAKQGKSETKEFERDGKKFILSFTPVPSADWIVVLVVPEDDVLEGARSVADDIQQKVTILIVIFVVVLVVLLVASYFGTTKLMKHIISPITELIDVTTRLVNNDTTADKALDTVDRSCAEIDALLDTYKHFVTALLFGNTTLMSGDLNRAMEIYTKALELFSSTGNLLAEGSCRNNMGTVHFKTKTYQRAEIEFENAIGVGEELLKQAETPEVARNYLSLLIGRMFNLGRMYQEMSVAQSVTHGDMGTAPKAEDFMYRALRLEQNTGNHQAFVQRACAYGFFLVDTTDARCGTDLERANKAERAFSEAMVSALKVQNVDPNVQTGCIQEAALGLGISWMIQGKVYNDMNRIAAAKQWLQYCLETGAVITTKTDARAIDALVQCASSLGEHQLVETLRPLAQAAVASRKNRRFVLSLDISGSMAGTRMAKAVAAIDSVFKKQVSAEHQDLCTLQTFNSTLTTIFRLGPKSQVEPLFDGFVRNPPRPSNMTALWDAIGAAFASVDRDDRFRDIIVVLTDGDDTSSKRYTYESIFPVAVASSASLFIVGVGQINDAPKLAQLAKQTDFGGYYAAESTDEISATFAKVEEDINKIELSLEAW